MGAMIIEAVRLTLEAAIMMMIEVMGELTCPQCAAVTDSLGGASALVAVRLTL
jgi:hypothetical protein